MLVLQLHRRGASKTLKVYGHKIAQSTSAMNVAELPKHVSKTVSNIHVELSISPFLSFFLNISFFLFFFFFLSTETWAISNQSEFAKTNDALSKFLSEQPVEQRIC